MPDPLQGIRSKSSALTTVTPLQFKDNSTSHRTNHSFLRDPRNESILGGQDGYLIRQIRHIS